MKKLITICLLIAASYSVKAQTKEETISWLTEKFNKSLKGPGDYLITKITKIEVSSCEIEISYSTFYQSGNLAGNYLVTMPTDGVILTDEDLKYKEERITERNLKNNKLIYYYNMGDFLKFHNTEPDLYARVKKALDHLASFCPKKKETF